MMMGNQRTSCTFTMQQTDKWGSLPTPKRIPTFMATASLSLVDNVICGFSL